jgi:hypothetical protein
MTPDAQPGVRGSRASRRSRLRASRLLGRGQRCVGAGQDVVERLACGERGKADADPGTDGRLERAIDELEPSLDVGEVGGTEPAHKLVASVAHHRIEGAQVRPHDRDEHLEHPIARRVAVAIVDVLEVVDIDERADEAPVAAPTLMGGRPAPAAEWVARVRAVSATEPRNDATIKRDKSPWCGPGRLASG